MCLYPELIDGGAHGKNRVVYYRTPGRRLWATLPTSPVRCLFPGDHRFFAVGGDTVYELAQDGSIVQTLAGTIINAMTPAQIISNGNQLFIISGNQGYLVNDGHTVVPIRLWDDVTDTPSGALLNSVMGSYLDGYFVAQIQDSQMFRISDNKSNLGGYKWTNLSYELAESNPDNIAAIVESHEEIRIKGTQASEVWQDSGNPPPGSPFSRNAAGATEQGVVAPWSLAKLDDESLMYLGGSTRGAGVVWRESGYSPVRASTHAVEAAIQQYSRIDDAVAYTYQENGHSFYCISFPTANATWCYDATVGMWHQRGYWNIPTASYVADLARFHAYAFGMHLVGGGDGTGKIYQQSMALSDDAGNPIRWWRRSPHVNLEAKMMRHNKLQLDMQVGVADQGTDPMVTLRTSNDGARTWGNERTVSSGKVGEYRKRVEWRRLGRSRDRAYEVYGTDPIPTLCLVDAYLDVVPGNGT